MPKAIENAYERYLEKVHQALGSHYSKKAIIDELMRERSTINGRCIMKQAELAQDRNIYKKREAARAAKECIIAIDRIITELSEPKEIPT